MFEPISPYTEFLDVHIALLEEKQSLLKAVADMTRACEGWYREAERRRREIKRLMLLAGVGWAALAIMALMRVLG